MTAPPYRTKVFQHTSIFPTTMPKMIAFHEDPRALRRLTPFPIVMQCLKDERDSLTSGEIEFRLWFGPIPVRWLARHEPGPSETSFADLMLRGPLAYWRHEHIFREVPGGIELTDRVSFAHKRGLVGIVTQILFGGLPLRVLFIYRHIRTRRGVGSMAQR